ncbi:MAG: dihydrolipoyl dehydrogenase [Gemmatimonadetes bacterium]|nr:dihydrolipoyl dehydrogenase [Gemmatimonadota bacterium]
MLVIGAGPAGYVCAIRAAQLGLKTGCVEASNYEGGLGGTCLNWGCIPAKALLESAALAQNLKAHGEEMGVRAENVVYDMNAAVDRSRFISDKLTGGIRFLFKKNDVELFEGRGLITGPGVVEVTPEEGDTYTVEAANIVVATGATMTSFPGFEIDGDKVIGSREALALGNLPDRMVVVGGGYVGVEFADVFNAFGADVTVVEMLDTLVPISDVEVGKTLARSFKKRGMTIKTGTKVVSLDREASPMVLTVESSKGEETIETDVLLMAVGRKPVAEGLGLDALGVEMDGPWIKINEWCESSIPGIYAIGDVAGQPMLAHKGSHEGIVAAERIAGVAQHPMRYDNIPSVGYCHPEVASIGLTEDEARDAGHEVKIGKYPLTSHGRALTAGHNEGFVKVIADAKYGEILGVHMIGYNVSELIGEVGMARALESTVEEIAAHAHAHPSMSEAVMEAALAAMDRAIHI